MSNKLQSFFILSSNHLFSMVQFYYILLVIRSCERVCKRVQYFGVKWMIQLFEIYHKHTYTHTVMVLLLLFFTYYAFQFNENSKKNKRPPLKNLIPFYLYIFAICTQSKIFPTSFEHLFCVCSPNGIFRNCLSWKITITKLI